MPFAGHAINPFKIKYSIKILKSGTQGQAKAANGWKSPFYQPECAEMGQSSLHQVASLGRVKRNLSNLPEVPEFGGFSGYNRESRGTEFTSPCQWQAGEERHHWLDN